MSVILYTVPECVIEAIWLIVNMKCLPYSFLFGLFVTVYWFDARTIHFSPFMSKCITNVSLRVQQ